MVWEDVRTAARFPMHLPVLLMVGGEKIDAITVNISQNGVLLRTDQPISPETRFEFLLSVPTEVTLDGATAAIHCAGYVIRTYEENGSSFVAAVIDDYRFQ